MGVDRERWSTHRTGTKSRVRPATANISATIGSRDTSSRSESYPSNDDDERLRTVEVDAVVEGIVWWDVESVV